MKVYTDATVIDQNSKIGYIVVDEGNIVEQGEDFISESKISQAELKSVIFAINNINYHLVDLYTDNHSVVDMYNGDGEPKCDEMQGLMWRLNKITEDIELTINYVRSEDNMADDVVKNNL